MPPSPNPSALALLILDLDGTLIDSRADLVSSVNATLVHLGRPALPEPEVARQVGNGAAALMQRALGLLPRLDDQRRMDSPLPVLSAADQTLADEALAYFLSYYDQHKLDATVLYPGVAEGLAGLAGAGYTLAVLTNKPVRPSREIVDHLGLGGLFCAVLGGNSFAQKKPDPVGIRALLEQCALPPRAAVMIGDSDVDIRTGRNAGTWTAGVTYGFAPQSLVREPPDWLASDFAQLAARLAPMAK